MAEYKLSSYEIGECVGAAQSGDAEAFGDLYDCFITPIFRYIFYRVDTRTDAEDIAEQVFLKAWEKLASYKTQAHVPFSAWLFRIAHNAVIDYYRSREKRTTTELSEEIVEERREADATDRANRHFQIAELRLGLQQLSDTYQQVIVLRFINELDTAEVAKILGKSEGAVRVLQHRALEKLKVTLSAEHADFVARWQAAGA